MVEARGIRKAYGKLEVLRGIDLEIGAGQVASIVGASGAGKSTLLQILGTLDHMDSGELYIGGQEVSKLKGNKLAQFRNDKLGFVFQFHHLLPEFTAIENICFPAYIKGLSKKEAETRAHELLELLHISERALHKPGELSGGEQQRVAVARALMNKPSVVLADEPSGNLDSQNASDLHQLFFQLRDELGQSFIIVTHNTELAKQADICFTIRDGLVAGN
ncbi:MAG: ABC transporter ATP-binding protein [Bacteroidetes bacterium]|nr:MAG: ABC transporter ATP-binding protein [Bacteroidota bacterium]